jgi:hypothetical protein
MAEPGAVTIASELDDALYYLRRDCVPCAERHFELARSLGATDEMIARTRQVIDQEAANRGKSLVIMTGIPEE